MKKLFLLIAAAFLFFSCTSIPKVPTVAEPVIEKNERTITAVQVSDAHFSREKPLFENTIALINSISPDLLFFTGDQIDSASLHPLGSFTFVHRPTSICLSPAGRTAFSPVLI